MIWKDPNNEEPIQSVPLLIILKWADLTLGDGGVDVAYADDCGFQGTRTSFDKEDIQFWCYLREVLEAHPLPFPGSIITSDEAVIKLAGLNLKGSYNVVLSKKEKTS